MVWFTGAEFGGFAGPSAASEVALAAYLDGGGCLFLSSQDYLWDRGGQGDDLPTAFMTDYLGVASGQSDQQQTTVTGAGPVFDGMGTYPLVYPFGNFSDLLAPATGAAAAWESEDGIVALSKEGDAYKTTYWAFPFEALPTLESRLEALQRFLDWCLADSGALFSDGFETGDTSRWSVTVP